ncbi:MAG: flagellar biosynthetic protein FliO [Terrisporobacter othiniensis]|uniref:Flagellar biosynthetic protein FliO n=2 Tax=Terrisporobacter TaxID=1505652 RepID=A0AAX2ZJJ4_9FIRM|nr:MULTISPECIES: flagellar biosynthetic protein FliO [Terrisporobacter]MBN9647275.1 FliO/MopB family protein [Terrisporobacter glycolicus]MDU4860373.1 flagellar biosynthetic protein FliO [Terrisporobacter othiniensis]MDU6993398.1 flagellar biosynthetic protein FliO [Terrisporobacter othiniensis]UEL48552.1 flagellar biosynthetic protein FliO [Terrisporobacter hibernicus]SFJ36768.1 flagellar protein FliO/FliZ [Terrisporobacter glycolicus]
MDNILKYIINLIVFVPFTIALIIITIRLSKSSINGIAKNKYIKVLERTNLNKDTELYVLKVGDEGCVIVSSSTKTDTIKELTSHQIEEIERKQEEVKINNRNNINLKLKDIKKFRLKEIKNERNNTNDFK